MPRASTCPTSQLTTAFSNFIVLANARSTICLSWLLAFNPILLMAFSLASNLRGSRQFVHFRDGIILRTHGHRQNDT